MLHTILMIIALTGWIMSMIKGEKWWVLGLTATIAQLVFIICG